MTLIHKTAVALACAGMACSALAQQAGDPSFSFSGFATLGAVRHNNEIAQFAIPGQPTGATDSLDFGVDSKLGLQFTGKLNAMFSGTLQVISKYNGDGNQHPAAEWLFGKAQVTPTLGIRVGRMGLPAFAVSDFRDVDYANLWVRPPLDVYGQVPVSHFDGADLIWQTPAFGANVTTQFFGGSSKSVYAGTDIELDSLYGFNATAEFDNGLTLRIGHFQTKLTVLTSSLAPLLGGLRAVDPMLPGTAAIAAQIDPTNKDASFSGIGVAYDQGNVIASMEYTKRATKSYVPDTTGWYASFGYRFGTFTPYLALSEIKNDDSNITNTIPVTANPTLEFLRQTVNGVAASQIADQKTTAVGVRWDVYRNTALKLQYERISAGSAGGFYLTTPPGFTGSNVLSIAANVVF